MSTKQAHSIHFFNRLTRAISREIISFAKKAYLFWMISDFTKKNKSTYAVIIAMPSALHLAIVSCRFLRKARPELPIIIILNGTDREEGAVLINLLHLETIFHVKIGGKPLKHDLVINTLIKSSNQDFWLVDHDCLVINGDRLKRAEDEARRMKLIGSSFFSDKCSTSVDTFFKPHTFLMFLRPSYLRAIMKSYRVSASPVKWNELNASARAKLHTLGFNLHVSPERGKDFWDTMAVLAFIAVAENVGFYQAEQYSAWFSTHSVAVHFGNTSTPYFRPPASSNPHEEGWGYRAIGAYYWRTCLDVLGKFPLRDRYLKLYPELADLANMSGYMLQGGIPLSTIDFIDNLSEDSALNQLI